MRTHPRRYGDDRKLNDTQVIGHREQVAHDVATIQPDRTVWPYPAPLLAQSSVDRLTSTAHELIIEGDSYRQRQRPGRHVE
jgi:hypothetical protein